MSERYLMVKSSGDNRVLLESTHAGIDVNTTANVVNGDVTVRDSTTGRFKERGSNLRIVWAAGSLQWANMEAALTPFLNSSTTAYTKELDLRGFTQFRIHAGVSGTPVASSKLGAQYSINATDFFGLDNGTANTLSTVNISDLSAAGRIVTAWATLNTAARISAIIVGIYGQDGDGAGDPVFTYVELEFR